jgi:hypothetical protein
LNEKLIQTPIIVIAAKCITFTYLMSALKCN